MDPLSIAAVGSSILGSIFGSSSQKKQLKLQREQFEAQKKLAEEQLALAREAQRQGLATQIDAAGNITAYDAATNTWKTLLSAEQQQILDATERESLAQLTQDAPLQRADRVRGANQRIQEGDVAGGLLSSLRDRLSGRGGYSSDAATSSLRLARERAVSQGFDDVSNTLSTQALRSGAGGFDRISGALARQRAQAIAQAMGNPDIEGRQIAQGMNAQGTSDLANLYNMFATRSSAGQVGASPVNATPNPQGLQAARAAALQGSGQAINGISNSSNTLGRDVPAVGNTMGELFGGISNLLQSPAGADIFNSIGGLFNRPNANLGNKVVTPSSSRTQASRGF